MSDEPVSGDFATEQFVPEQPAERPEGLPTEEMPPPDATALQAGERGGEERPVDFRDREEPPDLRDTEEPVDFRDTGAPVDFRDPPPDEP